MEQSPKQQVVERIKSSANILVTVSNNPSVDQLAACIGFTLMLNKLGKHATAVFSGVVPSTIEFLQPEKTLEKNTDSLQDFIIALDKSKADKLRYKVEDDVVRIFITPYRTSISEKDLDFSLGDFNVDVVIALGVLKKEEIDQAIIAHGRILHDATVMSVTSGAATSDVGAVNWNEPTSSSLSEMLVSISESFQSNLLDPQMATSFLTGIVSETDRFSNNKTSPKVMTMSAQLMAAGANQQLIATKLTPPEPEPEPAPAPAPEAPPAEEAKPAQEHPAPKPDGQIDIQHEHEQAEEGKEDEIHIDDEGNLKRKEDLEAAERAKRRAEEERLASEEDLPAEEPLAGDSLLATTHKVVDPLPGPAYDPLLPALNLPPVQPQTPALTPEPTSSPEPVAQEDETLAELEREVNSPHIDMVDNNTSIDGARQAVATANLDSVPRPEPMQSLGAQHVDMGDPTPAPADTMNGITDIVQSAPSADVPPAPPADTMPADPMAPPPVPPPMTMPFFEPKTSHHNPYLNPNDQPTPDSANDKPL